MLFACDRRLDALASTLWDSRMMGGNQNECRVSWLHGRASRRLGSAWQLGGLGHLPAAVVVGGAYRVGPATGLPSAWTEAS